MMQLRKHGQKNVQNAAHSAVDGEKIGEADHWMSELGRKVDAKRAEVDERDETNEAEGSPFALGATLVSIYRQQSRLFYDTLRDTLQAEYNAYLSQELLLADKVPDKPKTYCKKSSVEKVVFWRPHFEKICYELMRCLHCRVCLDNLLADEHRYEFRMGIDSCDEFWYWRCFRST